MAVDVFDPRQSRPKGYGTVRVSSDIWIVDAASGVASQFTFDPAADFDPLCRRTARGSCSRRTDAACSISQERADGSGPEKLLFESPTAKHAQAWSPDGRFVVFGTYDPPTHTDLWMLSLDGDRQAKPLLRTEFSEEQAPISPDGRWFSYASDESGAPTCTCSPSRHPVESGGSRRAEAATRDGGPTAASSSTLPVTGDSWPLR